MRSKKTTSDINTPRLQEKCRLVREQYEKHPYPQLPLLALPEPRQAHTLSYEWGQFLRTGRFLPHSDKTRILVAGSGSFEALLVARAHPRAQITAFDLSRKSLRRLQLRAKWAGLSRRIDCIQGDLHDPLLERVGAYDYVICTGVLHHSSAPASLLARLREVLAPTGVLRLMTYANNSRMWIYAVSRYLRACGLRAADPGLFRKSWREMMKLPIGHPLRSAFETYSDNESLAGLIDGFYHAFDRPVPILTLAEMCRAEELHLLGFGHAWHSQPEALREALLDAGAEPKTIRNLDAMNPWQKLSVLDDLGELTINPVYWLGRNLAQVYRGIPEKIHWNPPVESNGYKGLGQPLRAPLLRPANPQDLYADVIPHQFESFRQIPRTAPPATLKRLVEGGLFIGDDGVLPDRLFECRYPTPREATRPMKFRSPMPSPIVRWRDEWAETFPELRDDGQAPADARPPILSPLRQQSLHGLRRAVLTLCGDHALDWDTQTHILKLLIRILEPRVGFDGKDLPFLSSGDLLRDLLARTGNPQKTARLLINAPPSFAENEEILDSAKGLSEAATRWWVEPPHRAS